MSRSIIQSFKSRVVAAIREFSQLNRRRLRARARFQMDVTVRAELMETRAMLTGDFDWAVTTGSTGSDVGNAIAVDAAGNVYTTGSFQGTVNFNPAGGTPRTSAGFDDVFVTKFDSAGNLIWATSMGGADSDSGTGIAVDPNGNVYVTGTFWDTATFAPGVTLTSSGLDDIFIAKLDPSGNLAMATQIGGTSWDSAPKIAVDASGGIYVTGNFYGTTSVVGQNLSSDGFYDTFIAALDTNSGFRWARKIGGVNNDFGTGIAVDANGDVVATGSFSGSVFFPDGRSITNIGSRDSYVYKFDSAGDVIFGSVFGGTGATTQTNGVTVDGNGNIYLAGNFYGNVDFDPGTGIANLSATTEYAGFISKVTADGDFLWARPIAIGAFPNGIAVDAGGSVYTTGFFSGSRDFDPSSGVATLRTTVSVADVFVSKFDTYGNFGWAKRVGGTSLDYGNAVAVDRDGNALVTGYFYGTVDFDPGLGVFNSISAGSADSFILKLSPDFLYTVPATLTGEMTLRRNGTKIELIGNIGAGNVVLNSDPVSMIRSIRIKGRNTAADKLTIDYKFGGPLSVNGDVTFDGGTDVGDTLRLIGNAYEVFTYAPSGIVARNGKFVVYNQNVNFTAIENAFATNFTTLTVEPQGSADVLSAALGVGYLNAVATRITGTTDARAITPITFDNLDTLTIDTGIKDKLLAASNDVVTLAAGSLEAERLRVLNIRMGKGNDKLVVNSRDLGLPVSAGVFSFLGEAGSDTLEASGDANWDLNDTRLISSGGGRIEHDGVEKATITGGASRNTISALAYTGDATLDGLAGNDVIRGGSGDDILRGGDGNDWLYGNGGDDQVLGQNGLDTIYGGDGNDVLTGDADADQIWGGTGNDQISGGDGSDLLYGDDGNDTILGGNGNDQLFGGSGNDILNGGVGIDLYDLQGTNNSEALQLQKLSATTAVFKRKPRGLSTILEQDSITMDANDEFSISALGGDDLISIDATFIQLGFVDGGDGIDLFSGPATWDKVSC